MDASYITPFIDSTKSVFSMMLNLPVKCAAPVRERTVPTADADVSAIIALSGDVIGTVILAFPEETAVRTVERFVGMAVQPDQEDFSDAVGELVNMVSGGAKAKFDGKDVSISCPSVVVGAGHRVQQMSDAVCIRIPCSSEFGPFAVEVAMKTAESGNGKGSAKNAATA